MSKINDLGLDMFGFGVESEAIHMNEPNSLIDNTTTAGIEETETLVSSIIELCDANDSLDGIFAAGIVDGLESINDTYQLILMSGANNLIESGVESEEIEMMLTASGLDMTEYSAGVEADEVVRKGGMVEPFRKAGSRIAGSKAYKAVADSFVGKGAKAVVDRIKRFISWLKNVIFGKATKEAKAAKEIVATKVPDAAKIKAEAENKYKSEIDSLKASMKEMTDAKDAEIINLKSSGEKMMKDFKRAAELYKAQVRVESAAADKLIKELRERLEQTESERDAAKNQAESMVRRYTGDVADAEVIASLPSAREFAMAHYAVAQLEPVVQQCATQLNERQIAALPAPVATVAAQAIQEVAQAASTSMISGKKLKKLLNSSKLGPKGKMGKSIKKSRKKQIEERLASPGPESFSLLDMIDDGLESMGYNLDEYTDEEYLDEELDDGVESSAIDLALAQYDMLMATEAGIESMNIEHFGHPYVGVDYENMAIYGVTPGVEAEDLGKASTDKKDDTTKATDNKDDKKDDKKEEGGFKKSLSRFGRGVKRIPSWIAKQLRKLFTWVASKSVILEGLFTKIQRLFSKNIDISKILSEEDQRELKTSLVIVCTALIGFDSTMKFYYENKKEFIAADTDEKKKALNEKAEKINKDKEKEYEKLGKEIADEIDKIKFDKVSTARVNILAALKLDKYAVILRKFRKFQKSKDFDIFTKPLDETSLKIYQEVVKDLNNGILKMTAVLRKAMKPKKDEKAKPETDKKSEDKSEQPTK